MSFQFISIDIHLTDISITFMNPNKRPPPPRHPDEYPLAEQPHKKIKTNSGSQTSEPGSYRRRWPEVYFPMLEGVLLKLSVNVKELNLSKSNLGRVGFLQFLDNSRLTILNLNQNNLISLRGLERCNFLSLEILYIRYNKLNENEPFNLYQMPRIMQIFLNANCLAYVRTPKLCLMCPKLTMIQLNNNPVVRLRWKKQEKIRL